MPVNPHEKAMQRALIQYRNPKNYDLVAEALKIAGRTDLIGFEKKCLIRPRNFDKSVRDEKEFHGHGAGSGSRSTRISEMKRAEMQMEKVQGEEIQVQAAETWKKAQAAK